MLWLRQVAIAGEEELEVQEKLAWNTPHKFNRIWTPTSGRWSLEPWPRKLAESQEHVAVLQQKLRELSTSKFVELHCDMFVFHVLQTRRFSLHILHQTRLSHRLAHWGGAPPSLSFLQTNSDSQLAIQASRAIFRDVENSLYTLHSMFLYVSDILEDTNIQTLSMLVFLTEEAQRRGRPSGGNSPVAAR